MTRNATYIIIIEVIGYWQYICLAPITLRSLLFVLYVGSGYLKAYYDDTWVLDKYAKQNYDIGNREVAGKYWFLKDNRTEIQLPKSIPPVTANNQRPHSAVHWLFSIEKRGTLS